MQSVRRNLLVSLAKKVFNKYVIYIKVDYIICFVSIYYILCYIICIVSIHYILCYIMLYYSVNINCPK